MIDKDVPLSPVEEPKIPFWKKTTLLGRLVVTMAFLVLPVTWLGSLGRYHWLLDLLSHFRLQYVVVCLVVTLLAAAFRRPLLCLAALCSFAWNFNLVRETHQTWNILESTQGTPLRVLIFNVLGTNSNHVAVIQHVLKQDADIVCLPEAREDWRADLEPLRLKYPYRVEELGNGDFSIACYTRLPLKSSEVRRLGAWGLPTILLNLDHLGTPVTFIGTHPMPPMTRERAEEWRAHLEQIGTIAANIPGEVIVGGDLNATPWCEGMRLLCSRSGLGFQSDVPVWPPTWGLNLPMMIPIDHVLLKGGLKVQKRTIGPDVGSDHRSVLVELVRESGSASR